MKANEAAEHSDVIRREGDESVLYCRSGKYWYYRGTIMNLDKCKKTDYVPLVPKKIYKVGDKAKMLEALQSGQCFKTPSGNIWKLADGKTYQWSVDGVWKESMFGFYSNFDVEYVEDPSIPPKPTLESLPAWTRCKVRPANLPKDTYDVIKKPTGGLMYYCNGKDFEWCMVALVSIYNPKTEQWEYV